MYMDPYAFTKEGIQQFIDERFAFYSAVTKHLGVKPTVSIFHDGGDPASDTYVRNKLKRFEVYGIDTHFADYAKLNHPSFVQQPTRDENKRVLTSAQWQQNDVEGFAPTDIVRQWQKDPLALWPCTCRGIFEHLEWVLKHYTCQAMTPDDKEGYDGVHKPHVVILGRSKLVGEPLSRLLLQHDYTVSVIHSKTTRKTKLELLYAADVIVCATGNRGVLEDFVPFVPVYDVGTNFVDGKLCGDVTDANKEMHWCAVTPVPGGVGKLTVEALCWNIIDWYLRQM